ncbi:PREDICTED: activating signal cointegrator 1 complex subunit 3-like [Acropora digitifera]|uniref:activating signal cointegrator 1 complex subunit 3-like n=1 Tax=Acropora digitifera TaxID=70779 RepID=UPI00077A86AB|nr:PREDICTED: activating signal cointegrator 1 complex subunit 3-like [Acropora digitifera]
MPPTELPRLTGSLRAFSGLSSSHSQQPEIDDLLKRKRQLRSKKQLERNLSWSELKSLILDATSFDKNATQEVKKLFKELLLTSKEIVCSLNSSLNEMPPTELPRLTGSLRAFSGLSSSHSQQPEIDDLLKRKRELRSKKQLERNLSWSELKSLILDATSFDKNATQEVKKLFKELLLTSKEIVGKESSADVLEGGTVFIFTTLKHSDLIGNDETKKLKDFFGAFPASAATKACHIVKNLVSLISEDSLALIEKRIEGKQDEQTKEFGSDIKFMPFQPRVFSFDDDLLSDSEDEEVEHKISFVPTREEVVSVTETVQTATMNGNEDISSSWLREQCELYFADSSSGLSVLDLCSALFDILASDRDNAALQNELFELLGFDRFEFIQTLLADRHRIVLATSQSASDLTESKGNMIIYVAPMKALAAEMVQNFGKRLASLGISVRELTGDMQLSKAEILKTQMLVTTPEKWDVVTRKSTGDVALAQLVKLLIIDEVHLLHDDRGSVIECLVARTLRQVESSQSMIRIVGLSATLPNYIDVAHFLRVNPYEGLFFFDGRFRPVPLKQTFIGVKGSGHVRQMHDMDTVCYEKVLSNVQQGHQVMVFVHARNATVKTALTLREMAANQGDAASFHAEQSPEYGAAQKQVMKSKNKQLRELFSDGFGIHHAGMLRQDRNIVEKLFAKGLIRVLVCTATLAWGVNLPAHAVVIKGTQMYDAKKGSFVDIGILDVLQIFGRAGRPQFDTQGEGIIITSHDKLSHYLALLTRQSPIESQFVSSLTDSLNAEISLGTVANVDEAVEWLSYTYLYIRMRVNPLVYGIPYGTKEVCYLMYCCVMILILPSKVFSYKDIGGTHTYLQLRDIAQIFCFYSGHMIKHPRMGATVKRCVEQFPAISLASSIQPITRTVLRVRLTIKPDFQWEDRVHGSTSEPWWIWVEDPDNNHIYHSEYFLLHKKQVKSGEEQTLVFTIPIFEPLPSQYYVRGVSDRWLGAEVVCALSFKHLILPERHPPHTELLDLQPLPVTALKCKEYELLYRFTHFNPVQTQVFHTVYHSDHNVLLGAPTGSGKTLAAELAIFRIFNEYPGTKAVYIAPLKALVRERMDDWKVRFEQKLGRSVVELTGDVTPDMRAIAKADVIVTTPEKWDGISRSWQTRNYVKAVALLVIDEIHLLGEERGPVLEVIVSRTNFISSHTEKSVRVIGLSTALANASDLADWLGIQQAGMFNFRPSVRPVPLEVHISGYPGKHYCPRMATMNKPTFAAIRTHSPTKPVLVFVSSRRQTRLTALELISFLAAEDNPKQWLHMPETEIDSLIKTVKDNNLKLTLSFGIALHHAGLHERDRKVAEELFVNQKIQILIATSTLAWGVNFPAHLVVVKGTEYYDGKTRRYVDFPITDVLQMMGRAGRPQYDDHGVAVILVHDIKKHFYKKFLYEPFPVESSLLEVLPDHLNAEIVAGTITSKQDAMDYLTWTYFFRRLLMNPSYYELEDTENESVNKFLSGLVEESITQLERSACVEIGEDGMSVTATTLGRISSYYYLSHLTLRMFNERLHADCSLPDLIQILASTEEYSQLPVRHNEDIINGELAPSLPLEVDPHSYDSPHTKAHLLFQAHFSRLPLPSTDYLTDTNSVLDQAIRILQAMIDVSSSEGWLATSLRCMHLVQMVVQGRWLHDCTLLTLPCVDSGILSLFRLKNRALECLPELLDAVRGSRKVLNTMLGDALSEGEITELFNTLARLPQISVKMKVRGVWAENELGQKETKAISTAQTEGLVRNWVQVHADQEYVIVIEIAKDSLGFKVRASLCYLFSFLPPSFHLSAPSGQLRSTSTVSVSFYTSEALGRKIYTVYLMNDAYLGMDQQYDVHLEIIESDISSQVNSEVHF